jgi:hypothetical protein
LTGYFNKHVTRHLLLLLLLRLLLTKHSRNPIDDDPVLISSFIAAVSIADWVHESELWHVHWQQR